MKVIDKSTTGNARGRKGAASAGKAGQLLGRLGLVSDRQRERQSQDTVMAALSKALNNQYVLLREVTLEGLDIPIPLVLIGPPGVRVIYASAARGVFRARGEGWEKMREGSRNYTIQRPNLVTRTVLMARAVLAYLNNQGQSLPEVEPVLVFTQPGVHVESVRPVVRVVLMDALDRFITGFVQSRPILSPEQVQDVVKLLGGTPDVVEPVAGEVIRDEFSFREERLRVPSRLDKIPRGDKVVSRLTSKVPFSTRQVMLLGIMVLINIIVLMALVLVVLRGS
jgi:hypothetical protein